MLRSVDEFTVYNMMNGPLRTNLVVESHLFLTPAPTKMILKVLLFSAKKL